MYVKIIVEIPKGLSSKQKDLLEEFDKLNKKNYERSEGFWEKVKGMFTQK